MKIKKLLGLLIAGTAMLAIAGAATAATHNINLYGASAQFSYWQISIGDYLANVAGADAGSVFSSLSNDGKHFIVKATLAVGQTRSICVIPTRLPLTAFWPWKIMTVLQIC